MSTFSIFIALILVVCFLLILVVMVQNPKGGGLSSSFGGGAQQMGGVQKTTDFLDRSTWVLATLLLVLILLSNFSLNSGQNNVDAESKLLDGNTLEQISTETIPEVIPEVSPEVPADSEEPAALD
ncbi:MAG: preprotein translocase subunit SecG [Flavobacteriaceae bacterium]|nr:preprotein translocase subunit SecG [Flavobacteriaceae bacterium]